MTDKPGSIVGASIWMLVLSVLLFWMPVLGPLVAGFVGGRKAGSLSNAILAALLPGLLVGGVIFFSASLLTGLPLFGLIAGAGGFVLVAAHVIPLILGAVVGVLV